MLWKLPTFAARKTPNNALTVASSKTKSIGDGKFPTVCTLLNISWKTECRAAVFYLEVVRKSRVKLVDIFFAWTVHSWKYISGETLNILSLNQSSDFVNNSMAWFAINTKIQETFQTPLS